MRIRYTDPPRIEWEERIDGRWVGRTITVNHRNLERFGIASPGPGGKVGVWHAKRLLAVLEREQKAGNAPKPLLTLSGLIDAYLASLDCSVGMKERRERVLHRVAKKPVATKPKVVDISLLSFVGDLPLGAVTSEKLVHYQNFLNQGGYAPMSVRDFMLDVRGLFRFAVRHKHMEASPAEGLRIPASEPRDEIEILTKVQVAKLLEVAGNPLDYDPLMHQKLERAEGGRRPFKPTPKNTVISKVLPGFIYLGLRKSELVKLQWEDIDFGRRVVLVRGARKNPTKSERRRAVPIPDPLFGYLKKCERSCEFVFTNSEGKQWNLSSLHSVLCRFRKTWGKALGFNFDFQTLRRTYGSLLFEAGYGLDQIGEFLGHTNFATTRTWYARLRAQDHHARVSKAFELSAAAGTDSHD